MLQKIKQHRINILILFGFVLFLVLIFSAPLLIKSTGLLSKDKSTDLSLPARLKIPKINIDASIDHVGIAPDGTMDVPTRPENAAWFNLGPRPGETGSSVIDGHTGWKNGIPAVFDSLSKLRKGDKIYVEDNNGLITTFVVREIKIYGKDDDALNIFNSSDGKSHLNLITCAGFWDKVERSHADRLVIFSDKE